jgi:uncharacterized repeat protein (TIGR04138 family)
VGADIRAAYLAIRKSGEDRYPSEFLEYLFRLVYLSSARGKDFRQLRAAELCAAFHSHVTADFGAMASRISERWGIRTFGDLGNAVFLLSRHGCFTLAAGETLEEYEAAGPIRFA